MWKDINKAPKDGSKLLLCWFDGGIPSDISGPWVWFEDENNPPIQYQKGIWKTPDKTFAWSVENPDGAPTHFKYYN